MPLADLGSRMTTPPARATALRVAILDDDTSFLRVLGKRLAASGWEWRRLAAPPSRDELVAMRLNALLLDPAVLGGDGWRYLELAADVPALGILVCTGPVALAERVRGLRLGADDWVTKPCHPEEVIARVEAVVRRRRPPLAQEDDGAIRAGELEIRPDRFEAFAGGRAAELTRREFELLQVLAGAPGRVLEREEIYQRVWGYAMAHGDRSVDVFVRKLRQKLERCSPRWQYIHTHFGVGYRFEAEPAAPPPA